MTIAEIAQEYGISRSTAERKSQLLVPRYKNVTIERNGAKPYKMSVMDFKVSDVRRVFGKKPK